MIPNKRIYIPVVLSVYLTPIIPTRTFDMMQCFIFIQISFTSRFFLLGNVLDAIKKLLPFIYYRPDIESNSKFLIRYVIYQIVLLNESDLFSR
jgi:hypothetical protein